MRRATNELQDKSFFYALRAFKTFIALLILTRVELKSVPQSSLWTLAHTITLWAVHSAVEIGSTVM